MLVQFCPGKNIELQTRTNVKIFILTDNAQADGYAGSNGGVLETRTNVRLLLSNLPHTHWPIA